MQWKCIYPASTSWNIHFNLFLSLCSTYFFDTNPPCASTSANTGTLVACFTDLLLSQRCGTIGHLMNWPVLQRVEIRLTRSSNFPNASNGRLWSHDLTGYGKLGGVLPLCSICLPVSSPVYVLPKTLFAGAQSQKPNDVWLQPSRNWASRCHKTLVMVQWCHVSVNMSLHDPKQYVHRQ